MKKIRESALCAYVKATTRVKTLRESGQGTTEYAILVGVSTSRNSLNGENIA